MKTLKLAGMVTIRDQSRTISATATFNTLCATPSCRQRFSKISGPT